MRRRGHAARRPRRDGAAPVVATSAGTGRAARSRRPRSRCCTTSWSATTSPRSTQHRRHVPRAHARRAAPGLDDDAEDRLGDATAFTGVAKYPARIKCALLGWAALPDALIKTGARPRRTHEHGQHHARADHRGRRRGGPARRHRPRARASTSSTSASSTASRIDQNNTRRHRHDAHVGGLPADRRHRGPGRRRRSTASSTASGSTGCGCRRGARRRSRRTAASRCGPSGFNI